MVIMFINRVAPPAIAAMAALALAACAPSLAGGSGTATDGRLKVVAAFYPLQYAAETVGGSQVDVTSLTAPGVEPHDVELTATQVASIEEADLVIYIPGFQPAVDEAVANEASGHARCVSRNPPASGAVNNVVRYRLVHQYGHRADGTARRKYRSAYLA